MTPEEILVALFRTFTEHLRLPAGFTWVPLAITASITIFGLLLLLRGAKWAPALGALAFLAIGGGIGSFLAQAVGTPLWPTVGVVGLVGFILGLILFRIWQALLLSLCFVAAGLSVYYVRVLTPEVENWLSATPQAGLVTLPQAGSVVGDQAAGGWSQVQGLYQHLDQNIADFTQTFWALTLVTALAGLIFGLLLPNASRSLWAATLGTLFFGIGLTSILNSVAPQALEWLKTNHGAAWGIVGLIWLFSMTINLLTCRGKKNPRDKDGGNKPEGKEKPALA